MVRGRVQRESERPLPVADLPAWRGQAQLIDVNVAFIRRNRKVLGRAVLMDRDRVFVKLQGGHCTAWIPIDDLVEV